MKRNMGVMAGGARWLWAVVALVAIAGVSDASTAKERKKSSASATPAAEAEAKAKSEAAKGYIGVYMQELTDEVRQGLDLDVTSGVLVSGVEDDGPAAEAGIEEGDVIVSFNGAPVSSTDDLSSGVMALSPGDKAQVELVRDGKSKTVTVAVGERPARRAIRIGSDGDVLLPGDFEHAFAFLGGPRLGVRAHEIDNDELASYFGAKKGDGVLVLSVEEKSVAAKAGVKPGDIIRQVGDEKISEISDLRGALRDYEEGDEFAITVQRHGKAQSLTATMDDQAHEFAFEAPHGWSQRWHTVPPAPRVRINRQEMQDDIRRELDDLKKEIRELKEELEARDDG